MLKTLPQELGPDEFDSSSGNDNELNLTALSRSSAQTPYVKGPKYR